MSYPIRLDQKIEQKQIQRLMMTPRMQQAIHLLQLPIMDLVQLIEQEIEQNPVLEYVEETGEQTAERPLEQDPEKELIFDEKKLDILKKLDDEFRDLFAESGPFYPRRSVDEESKKAFLDSLIQEKPSLWEHLLQQAKEVFDLPSDLKMAEVILGHLDASGMLKEPLDEIAACFGLDVENLQKVLKKIQTFEPAGVGSQNVQQLFLLQLTSKGKQDSLAYKIVQLHYEDLLHNRLSAIQRGLQSSLDTVKEAIQKEIASLDLHPGDRYNQEEAQTLIADIRLKQEGNELVVEVNEEPLQRLKLNPKYVKMLDDTQVSKETKAFVSAKLLSAKWLMKNISARQSTLVKIAEFLSKYQKEFFLERAGNLLPLTMQRMADDLHIHESTAARAVAHKYIDTPRGIFPIRYFFTHAYTDEVGRNVSSTTIKDMIADWIKNEDTAKPLSDETISKKLLAKGILCARRTVAKYRMELKLGNTQQRKRW